MQDSDPARILAPVFGGVTTGGLPPAGYQPLGRDAKCPGADPGEIPQKADELGELVSYAWESTVRRAVELSIPVAGTIGGSYDRRVIVWEWTRYKVLDGEGGTECRYGYVVRFCVTVSKWDAQAKVSLPFLSAQAELGHLQAAWMMQVRGLVGPKIDAVVLPPQDLRVETFVVAHQSLVAVIAAINDPTTKFVPGILLARVDPSAPEAEYWKGAVQAFAADSLRRGRSRSEAQARLGSTDPNDHDLLARSMGSSESLIRRRHQEMRHASRPKSSLEAFASISRLAFTSPGSCRPGDHDASRRAPSARRPPCWD